MKKRWGIVILAVGAIGLISLFIHQFVTSGEERLDPAEVQQQLERMYAGEVTALEVVGEEYKATITRDDGIYEVRTDRLYGNVFSLVKLQEGERITENSSPTQEEPSSAPETTPEPNEEKPAASSTRLTEQQISEIALAQVQGTIEDIDFEESQDGGYYLVEVERPAQNGDDDGPEATLQIQAITGEVLSIVWDD
ncbi:PepSY domain-containing protein [Chryseomicrobium palamuruense]|uniref:PepSY domain-containing protein n=1 Tax=Chryseomicrobium palamuruense TaxID=682973 RepID=A0ABV8UVH5_9BACL